MKRVLLTVFCHYYIEQEPQHCFVAVNEEDEAVGYVLCAADFMTWEEKFTELYMKKSNNPVTKMLGKGTIDGLRSPDSIRHICTLTLTKSTSVRGWARN